jgi:hypothetical protein
MPGYNKSNSPVKACKQTLFLQKITILQTKFQFKYYKTWVNKSFHAIPFFFLQALVIILQAFDK